MADKRISQLVERTDIANNDVLPIVASGATTTNKVTVSTLQDWMQDNLDVGVTSVGLSMPSAFTVTNSPVTTSGNISVVGAGTVSQYIRGDGSLADFPQGGGGGGASVNYYLNGSVSQGTIGGIAYYEMNKVPILGTGTDFVAIADGYLASFITDAGDPSLLQIPGGNWNFETYFSASSGGGTPTFYVELYKVDSGGTATLIASNSGTPELIAFGTTITPYFSTLAVPTTTLALTDRLALRYYVARSGRTITMHTENSHLCQIITTFTTGLTALNGLTAQVQNFATGTSGSDFNISSSTSTHTFNLPNASDTARGVVTTGTQTFAGYKIFNGTIGVNNDLQLVTVGTALNTFIKNINSTGLTSIGSNGFGFNNANNIYFSGSNKGGGVFAFSNTGTQTYTLQDASGTLAFTSQIPTNPVGGTGAAGRVAYWNGSGTITSDSLFQWNDTFKRLGIGRTPTVSLDVEGAGFFSSSVTATANASGRSGLFGGTSFGLRIDNSGSFNNGGSTIHGVDNTFVASYQKLSLNGSSLEFMTDYGTKLTIANSGAATFSSSVTTGSTLQANGNVYVLPTISGGGSGGLFLGVYPETPYSKQAILVERYTSTSGNYGRGNLHFCNRDTADANQPTLADSRMTITSSGNVGIGTASPGNFNGTSFAGPFLDVAGLIQIKGTSSNTIAGIQFGGDTYRKALIYSSIGTEDPYLSFATASSGSSSGSTERMRITSGGNVLIGTQTANGNLNGIQVNNGSGTNFISINTSTSGIAMRFYTGTSVQAGYILVDGSSTSYVTSSDYRLKEDLQEIKGLEKVSALKVYDFKWKDSENRMDGVLAHELAEVIPCAVHGEKDAVDEEGNEIMQGVDYSKIVPVLIKAIQELKAEIDSLKTK
jgi:hypothetical protein